MWILHKQSPMAEKLDSFYVVPGYTFFYWGFNVVKKFNDDFISRFQLNEGVQNTSIKLLTIVSVACSIQFLQLFSTTVLSPSIET